MSEPARLPAPSRPYLAICYLSLAAVFLTQLQQGMLLVQLPALVFGLLGILFRRPQAPLAFLVLVGAGQVANEYILHRFRASARLRFLDVEDVLLCVGVLGYVAAHYRLQAIWNYALMPDARRRTPRRWFGLFSFGSRIVLLKRPESQVTAKEISVLAVSLPVWALAAQALLLGISPQWDVLGLELRVIRMLVVLWVLALGVIVVGGLLWLWQRRRMDRQTAQLFLQDVYWRETRGEQRRLERWLAWKRIKEADKGVE